MKFGKFDIGFGSWSAADKAVIGALVGSFIIGGVLTWAFGRWLFDDTLPFMQDFMPYVLVAMSVFGASLILFGILIMFSVSLAQKDDSVTSVVGTTLIATTLFVNVLAPPFIDVHARWLDSERAKIQNTIKYGPEVTLEQRRNLDKLISWVEENTDHENPEIMWRCDVKFSIRAEAPEPPKLNFRQIEKYDVHRDQWTYNQSGTVSATNENILREREVLSKLRSINELHDTNVIITLSHIIDRQADVLHRTMNMTRVDAAAIRVSEARLKGRHHIKMPADDCF